MTDQAIRSSKKARMFPLLPMISGGLMSAKLDPGDTIYVPQKLIYTNNLELASSVTQIIASSASSLAVIALLGSQL